MAAESNNVETRHERTGHPRRASTELTLFERRTDQKFEKLEEKFDAKLEQKLEEKFDAKLEKYATKADLELCVGALLEKIKESETRVIMVLSAHVSTELARHVAAFQESVKSQIAVIDDK